MLLKKLIHSYQQKKTNKTLIQNYYSQIVLASRNVFFFETTLIDDNVDKRLDLLILHLCLATIQTRQISHGKDISQDIFDIFLYDMDINLREMGVGDLSVPKKMKHIGALFYKYLKQCEDTMTDLKDCRFENYFCTLLAPKNELCLQKYLKECQSIITTPNIIHNKTFPQFPHR